MIIFFLETNYIKNQNQGSTSEYNKAMQKIQRGHFSHRRTQRCSLPLIVS